MEIIDNAPLIRQRDVENIIDCNSISVQVAGTNGKGSTCAFLSSILEAHDKRVGLYTSPHLIDICERISINGINIKKTDFDRLISEINGKEKGLCKSDLMFFAAVRYFNENNVDYAVFETGLGGTRDSATLIYHKYGIITQIGLDHMEYLGDTVEEIAKEKAGIVKECMEVVAYPNSVNYIIGNKCNEMRVGFIDVSGINIYGSNEDFFFKYNGVSFSHVAIQIHGEFQRYNCGVALICAMKILGKNFSINKAIKAVGKVTATGRISILKKQPIIIADVSHNVDGALGLLRYVSQLEGKKCGIIAIPKTKDYQAIMELLKKGFDYTIGVAIDEKSQNPELLGVNIVAADFEGAAKMAVGYDVTVCCGSFAVARRAVEYFS